MSAKKKDMPVSDFLAAGEADTLLADDSDAPAPLHVVEPPKPKPKPGEPDYDWAAEYPGEECFVYTVPEGAERSPVGLTVGMTKMGVGRRPKPGLLRRLYRDNDGPDMNLLWYFLELVSSPNSLAVQEELDPDEYNDMTRKWANWAGIELSESRRSSML